MRDQDDNLRDLGLDATVFINSSMSAAEKKVACQRMIEGRYQFVFISPERLVIDEFRNFLAQMDGTRFVYCVVDEGHCVSEWGHDFRTAYLSLGDNARKHCKRWTEKLPIVALTGTASYDALADVERELNLVRDADTVRPKTFKRFELHFEVVDVGRPQVPAGANAFQIREAVAKQKQSALLQVLRSLPSKFGFPEGAVDEFFALRGDETNSGLVFCPHVGKKWLQKKKGGEFGVIRVSDLIKNEIPELSNITAFFAGGGLGDPEVQRKFKDNELSLLVATKAFGMGIDKPNIRYTIHFSMPPSIEAFYQEAGRAGRDKQKAYCLVLYCDLEVKSGITVDKDLMLYFHNKAFPGKEREKRILLDLLTVNPGIEAILEKMQEDDPPRSVVIHFENNIRSEQDTFKAIYRLSVIGVITEYTLEYQKRVIDAKVKKRIDHDYIKHLQDYIRTLFLNRGKVKNPNRDQRETERQEHHSEVFGPSD